MTRTVTLRLDDATYAAVKAAAVADRRSIASLIETAALRHLEETAFMNAAEERELHADRGLMKRLREGHADAAARRT
jgi:hypothetical protein